MNWPPQPLSNPYQLMPVIALATSIPWQKFQNGTRCLTESLSQMNVTSLTININFLNRELVELTTSASIKSLSINASDSFANTITWQKFHNGTRCLTESLSQLNFTSLTSKNYFLNRELVELSTSASIKHLAIYASDSYGNYHSLTKVS